MLLHQNLLVSLGNRILMARSFEVVNFVFTSSRVVKTVHLDLHTGTFPYTQLIN